MNDDREIAEQEIDLRRVWDILVRRRYVLLGVFAAVVVAGVLITVRAPRIYKASASVLIEQTAPEVLGEVREVYSLGDTGYWSSKEYYETQYNVLRSRPVAQKAAAILGLSPAALKEQIASSPPPSLEAVAQGDELLNLPATVREKLGLLGLGDIKRRADVLAALEGYDAAAYVRSLVMVEPVKNSRLTYVSVELKNPEHAARIANAVVDAYIEYNIDQKVEFTRSAVDWLSGQAAELREKLQASELALYGFKKDNNVVSVSIEDRQTMTAETLSQLNRSLSEVRARRLGLESRMNQIERIKREADVSEVLTEVLESSVVQSLKRTYVELTQEESELRLKYTDEHPKLVAVRQRLALVSENLRGEVDKIIRSIQEEYRTTVETETRIEREIESVKAEALELNKKEIDYSRLKRERDNNQALYDLVLKRQKEADLSQLLKVNNVRRLEAALTPDYPVRPRASVNVLLSVLVGLVLALGAAFALEFLDNGLKTQEQVEERLGLAFLGVVPSMEGAGEGGTDKRELYILAHPRSSVAECCRAIRTNLLFSTHEKPARSILVTSSGPREGKSTTATNLAVTMAQAGARTVIIDTDMRRPRLHTNFGIDNEVGLSSLILATTSMDRAVRATEVPLLDVLTCGPIPPNPAELLHTESFRRIIEELGKRYERLIFDSPPVGAVADPLVLASMLDGAVLVTRAGQTSWRAALLAKRRLEGVGGRIVGAVLNDVDLTTKGASAMYQYYYDYRSADAAEAPAKGSAG